MTPEPDYVEFNSLVDEHVGLDGFNSLDHFALG